MRIEGITTLFLMLVSATAGVSGAGPIRREQDASGHKGKIAAMRQPAKNADSPAVVDQSVMDADEGYGSDSITAATAVPTTMTTKRRKKKSSSRKIRPKTKSSTRRVKKKRSSSRRLKRKSSSRKIRPKTKKNAKKVAQPKRNKKLANAGEPVA